MSTSNKNQTQKLLFDNFIVTSPKHSSQEPKQKRSYSNKTKAPLTNRTMIHNHLHESLDPLSNHECDIVEADKKFNLLRKQSMISEQIQNKSKYNEIHTGNRLTNLSISKKNRDINRTSAEIVTNSNLTPSSNKKFSANRITTRFLYGGPGAKTARGNSGPIGVKFQTMKKSGDASVFNLEKMAKEHNEYFTPNYKKKSLNKLSNLLLKHSNNNNKNATDSNTNSLRTSDKNVPRITNS